MSDYLLVLAVALLPVAGNFAGSLLAELTRPPEGTVGAALHGAAGVAIAVVAVDLMPRILEDTPAWLISVAFLAGAAFSLALARFAQWLCRRMGGQAGAGAWMVFVAVGADVFADGLMTGMGGAISISVGLLLGLSQVIANVPGGFAAAANLRHDGVPRVRRLLMTGLILAPVLVGASGGYLLLRGRGEAVQNAGLAFVVGVLLLATVEDVIPQGDEPQPKRIRSTAAFASGFAGFALLAAYLG